jgi:hypothetical protein
MGILRSAFIYLRQFSNTGLGIDFFEFYNKKVKGREPREQKAHSERDISKLRNGPTRNNSFKYRCHPPNVPPLPELHHGASRMTPMK